MSFSSEMSEEEGSAFGGRSSVDQVRSFEQIQRKCPLARAGDSHCFFEGGWENSGKASKNQKSYLINLAKQYQKVNGGAAEPAKSDWISIRRLGHRKDYTKDYGKGDANRTVDSEE